MNILLTGGLGWTAKKTLEDICRDGYNFIINATYKTTHL